MSEYLSFALLICVLVASAFLMQWMESRNDDSSDW